MDVFTVEQPQPSKLVAVMSYTGFFGARSLIMAESAQSREKLEEDVV